MLMCIRDIGHDTQLILEHPKYNFRGTYKQNIYTSYSYSKPYEIYA